jgi:hypothetical protein|tara:strand:+ start:1867 stop:2037 length:171 start_codon:yes stop_codon:yes gene_type:complete
MTTGLYDNLGVLRFSGSDRASCLAYAELFGLRDDDFTLVTLVDDQELLMSELSQAA